MGACWSNHKNKKKPTTAPEAEEQEKTVVLAVDGEEVEKKPSPALEEEEEEEENVKEVVVVSTSTPHLPTPHLPSTHEPHHSTDVPLEEEKSSTSTKNNKIQIHQPPASPYDVVPARKRIPSPTKPRPNPQQQRRVERSISSERPRPRPRDETAAVGRTMSAGRTHRRGYGYLCRDPNNISGIEKLHQQPWRSPAGPKRSLPAPAKQKPTPHIPPTQRHHHHQRLASAPEYLMGSTSNSGSGTGHDSSDSLLLLHNPLVSLECFIFL